MKTVYFNFMIVLMAVSGLAISTPEAMAQYRNSKAGYMNNAEMFLETKTDRDWASATQPAEHPSFSGHIWYYRPPANPDLSTGSKSPTVKGVLGLRWGIAMDDALRNLSASGYDIKGVAKDVVYMSKVGFLKYTWSDAALKFDDNKDLNYAQFSMASELYDTSGYDNLYGILCSTFGQPVSSGGKTFSWYTGDGQGFINLRMTTRNGHNYTEIAFGI